MPTELSDEQKLVGRRFRDACMEKLAEANELNPPSYTPPNFLGHFRHNCSARLGQSSAIELKEIYWSSADDVPGWDAEEVATFAFIFRQGMCRGCGEVCRSRAGRIVLAQDRPPTMGKMAR